MQILIKDVQKGSIAEEIGITAGDKLLLVNNEEIRRHIRL